MCPFSSALATPNEMANTISPTTSSRATTGSRIFVSGPSALYCFTTISVAAGAVAVATAPSVIAADSGSLSGIIKCIAISTTSTKIVATTAWNTAITIDCLPVFRRSSRRNSLPIANAIKPSAMSQMMSYFDTSSMETKPIPKKPSLPRQNGPIRMPATRYAVTAGRFQSFVSRDMSSPANRAMDKASNVVIVIALLFIKCTGTIIAPIAPFGKRISPQFRTAPSTENGDFAHTLALFGKIVYNR